MDTIEKAYMALTSNSITTFHNYFQELIKRHREEAVALLNKREEYEDIKLENENFHAL